MTAAAWQRRALCLPSLLAVVVVGIVRGWGVGEALLVVGVVLVLEGVLA